ALSNERSNLYAKTLEQRIRLVGRALVDGDAGDALGVFRHHRTEVFLGCLQALASLVFMQLGDAESASRYRADAETHLPEERLLAYLAFVHAERFEDWERYATLGESLARAEGGSVAAWLWLQLAFRRWQLGDTSGARKCVTEGLEVAPHSLALRAFDVQLAIQKEDGLYLASALEATTECFESERAKAEWLLAAAAVWALFVRDVSSSKAAVSQSSLHGLSPESARQANRLLAIWAGDLDWYLEATQAQRDGSANSIERLDLSLEMLRTRLQAGDDEQALRIAHDIADNPDAGLLGNLLDATLGNCLRRKLGSTEQPHALTAFSWSRLQNHTSSPELQNALRLGSVVDSLMRDDLAGAAKELDELARVDPSDLMLCAARTVVAERSGHADQAAAILLQSAAAQSDAGLRSTLALEGALLGLRSGVTAHVSDLLDLAAENHPEAVQALSRWALRQLSDRSPRLADRVMEAASETGSPIRRALEHVGLSLARGEWGVAVPAAEDFPREPAHDGLELAAALMRSVAVPDEPVSTAIPDSLAAARAALAYLEGPDGSPPERLERARAWAKLDSSAAAQLEWFLAAHQCGAYGEEAEAREQLASHLSNKDAEPLRVSAQIQRFLSRAEGLQLVPSTSAAARLANLETALPGSDPRRRAAAIEESGELVGATTLAPLNACLALNRIAAGEHEQARSVLTELVETQPRFIPGWLGLRLLAELIEDDALLAQACAALGDLLSDPVEAATEWERAATLLLDRLSDSARGLAALKKSVELDVTRDQAFFRLFRLVRDSQDAEALLGLIAVRLPHAKSSDERLMLHWERARTMRGLGDREGALAALEAVSAIDPNHVGALALSGEVNIGLGRYDDAARYLAQLARQTDAPVKQRLMGGLAAADLFDKKLNRPSFAKDILVELHREGHSTEALRERLAALAIRVNAHALATEVLEILMEERANSSGRADAARLAMVLYRDHRLEPARAARAVDRLLKEVPGDAEAVDLILTGCFDRGRSERWLEIAEDHLRAELLENPLDTSSLARLAQIADYFDDTRVRQACLGAILTLGHGSVEIDRELFLLEGRVANVPAMAIDDATLQEICDPSDVGPVADLFRDFSEVFAEALGPSLQVLSVGKKQRIDPRAGLPLRNEIVAWGGAFGIKDFDLYVTDRVVGDVIAVPAERPSIVAASNLPAPLDARGRQAVARELFLLRKGTGLLRHRSPAEVVALVVAACQVGGFPIVAAPYAMLDEFVRALSSTVPRRLKKNLADRAAAIQSDCQTDAVVADWVVAALSSQDRAAALATGDVSHVLAHLTGQRGRPPETRELRERAARLLSFVISPQYLQLKDKLGLSVR
ncbi:MAG TPA: tetratricopeptide repeat protein, partial [Polyangiaceae bacterium]|nr:tetratricopeptide repeat protein [Polyangiaceae bacterium]